MSIKKALNITLIWLICFHVSINNLSLTCNISLIFFPLYQLFCNHISINIRIFPVCFQSFRSLSYLSSILLQFIPAHLSIIPAPVSVWLFLPWLCQSLSCPSVCSCICQPVRFPPSQQPAPVSHSSQLTLINIPAGGFALLRFSCFLSLSLSHRHAHSTHKYLHKPDLQGTANSSLSPALQCQLLVL